MAKARMAAGLMAGCLLLWSGTTSVWAAKPTPAEILRFRPNQEGVVYSTPTAQEQTACKVERATEKGGGNGWWLLEGWGRPLRRSLDRSGDRKSQGWSTH